MTGTSHVSVEAVSARIKEFLADMLDDLELGVIPDDLPLFDTEHPPDGLELDSLDALKLAVALANEYDLDPAAEIDYSEVRTVAEIAEYVYGLVAGGREP